MNRIDKDGFHLANHVTLKTTGSYHHPIRVLYTVGDPTLTRAEVQALVKHLTNVLAQPMQDADK